MHGRRQTHGLERTERENHETMKAGRSADNEMPVRQQWPSADRVLVS